MNVFLRDIKIKGIKNLKDEVELVFSKKEIKDFSELKDNKIKSIYGPNGSGKTAIVHAFSILKNVVSNKSYLHDPKTTKYLNALLNKECNCYEISLNFFYTKNKKQISLYSYELKIESKNSDFYIAKEKYSKRKNEYSAESILIEVIDGNLKEYEIIKKNKNKYLNLMKKSSFMSLYVDFIIKNILEDIDIETNDDLFAFMALYGKLNPVLDAQDMNFTSFFKDSHDHLEDVKKMILQTSQIENVEQKYNFQRVPKIFLKNYEKNLKNKEQFLKIFKPNIKRLDYHKELIIKEKTDDIYEISEYIVYDNYAIDIELESVGIKKFLNLYEKLAGLSKGNILIIDELDSHINDVYLIKLIEYLSNYSKGQLIFTTHNISPMEVLKTKKHSIDFLSISGKLTSWTQVGNYSPTRAYQSGMISRLPFNVREEDFIRVFGNELR